MRYTGYELLWLFFLYSFGGWVLETIFATIRQKNFANRGLINGPVCIMYGFSAVFIEMILHDLTGIWLYLFATVNITVIEWIAGHLVEIFYHERWWDYSGHKFNLDGYISLSSSLTLGALGYLTVRWGNSIFVGLFNLIPGLIGTVLIWSMVGILLLDNLASLMLLAGRSGRLDRWEAVNSQIANVTARLAKWIAGRVEKRIHKAYPKAYQTEKEPREKDVFASGCGFYKLAVLFFVSAFLGDVVETIWCRIAMGSWMSRSSVVWGPFSVVWGIAVAAVTALLHRYRNRSCLFLFVAGTLLGGAYEYLCSVVLEAVTGKIFWDYSGYRFNLGGRINLTFCLFWGAAAIIWFKGLYPRISRQIEKIPVKIGKVLTWMMLVFMVCNLLVSYLALNRYTQREEGIPAANQVQEWLDENYSDEVMERIYPKAKDAP